MDQKGLKERARVFASRFIRLIGLFPKTIVERPIARKIIQRVRPVAVNYCMPCTALSKSKFNANLGILLEDADEKAFRLKPIMETRILPEYGISPLLKGGRKLAAIFVASRKTATKSSIDNLKSKIGDQK